MGQTTFMKGAVVLAAAGAVIKALGAVFRIPLGNMIGDGGMGYYQAAYTIYVMFLTLSNSGLPVSISRLVSERVAVGNRRGAHRVFKVSFILMGFIGTVSFLVCFFGADALLSRFPNMGGAAMAVRAIAPALLIVPLMASFRGYFQGMQNMKPTANSQITEQFFRVASGLSLAYLFLPSGLEAASAGAASGASVGAAFGLLAVALIYALSRKSLKAAMGRADGRLGEEGAGASQAGGSAGGLQEEPTRGILLGIFLIAVPITVGAAIMPIMNFIDLAFITNRLSAIGWAAADVKDVYGQFTGFANPLINLPQILTQAVAMSLVPAVAAAYKRGDVEFMRHNIQLGLRTAVIIGLPCAFGIMALSEQILLVLYPSKQGAAMGAAPFLFILAFGIIFLSMVQTLTGVLQGVGRQMTPVRNLFIGAGAKILVTWVLLAVPAINVKGAALGTVTAYIVASMLNLAAVSKHTGTRFDIKLTFGKPVMAAAVMGASVWLLFRGLSALLSHAPGGRLTGFITPTLVSIGVGAVIYAFMILACGAITREELSQLPHGRKLLKLLPGFIKK
ncbi:MAG: polysaccharide biosynthesis protein [Clostridiales Family XIII bacterium]|jgi:stage V sporulation protein B|nr:polysaccharide biosynthesis protein [Clostridiales Family XIII bacterium]